MMNSSKRAILGVALALSGLLAAEAALAGPRHHHHHGSRVRFAFHFGAPIGIAAWGYPHYYYYPPAPVYYSAPVVIQQPPVYIEQQPAPAPAQSYWYYCAGSQAYYPYVRDCPGGWQRVAPRPN